MRMRTIVGTALVAAFTMGSVGLADPLTVQGTANVSWSANRFIQLMISEENVDLGGPIGAADDAGSYDPETGTWTPLQAEGRTGWVLSNNPNGYTLTARAENVSGFMPADLDRFFIKGWTLSDWTQMGTQTLTLGTRTNAGRQNIDNFGYRYEPSFDDAPGDYQVLVTFTATTQ